MFVPLQHKAYSKVSPCRVSKYGNKSKQAAITVASLLSVNAWDCCYVTVNAHCQCRATVVENGLLGRRLHNQDLGDGLFEHMKALCGPAAYQLPHVP